MQILLLLFTLIFSNMQHPKHKWDEAPFVDTPLPAPWGGYYDDDEEIARLQNLGQTSFLVEQAGVGRFVAIILYCLKLA